MAIEEDVDAIGLSIHSGAHMTLFPRVMALLHEQGAADILLFGGGIIPEADRATLKAGGVAEIFGPGDPTTAAVAFLEAHCRKEGTLHARA